MSIKKYTGTREQWLEKAVKEIYKQLKLKGYTDFIKQASEIKVSFGHMPKGMKNSTIGVCQYTSEDADLDDLDKKGTRHLFIRPTLKANNLEETLDLFQVLAHEVCHAVLPAGEGHKKSFKDLIIGLLKAEGKPTATVRGSEFDKWAKPIVKKSLAKIGAKTLARFVGPVGIALTMADVGNFITRAGKSVMPGLKERAKREAEGGNMYTSSKL